MKISTIELNNSTEYIEFIDEFIDEMNEKFYGIGYCNKTSCKLLQYIKCKFVDYINVRCSKPINLRLLMPKNSYDLIDKQRIEKNNDLITIYLSSIKIEDYLDGQCDIYDYLLTIIDQIVSEIDTTNNQFNNYLVVQMDILCDICFGELSNIRPQVLKKLLLNYDMWKKLANKSSIFNDYYKFFNENREINKESFAKFIRKLIKRCETL